MEVIEELSNDGLILRVVHGGQSIAVRGPKSAIQKWRETILSVKPELLEFLLRSANDDTHLVVVRFTLSEFYGNPPVQGGGIVIGESFKSIRDELKIRYGARLVSTESEHVH